MNELEVAATSALTRIGPGHLRMLADRLADGWQVDALCGAVPTPGFAEAARSIVASQAECGVPLEEAVAYLRGVAAGHAQREAEVRVEGVWSGPATSLVPVRATAQVLVDVVGQATRELILATYAARPYEPLLDALSAARGRGVSVDVVVETLSGAGSALAGAEPAAAFAAVPHVRIWHWPTDQREESGSRMHAKLAVADRRTLLVSSANLTQSGVTNNIEAGLLVTGGPAPERAAEHLLELQAHGVLKRLYG